MISTNYQNVHRSLTPLPAPSIGASMAVPSNWTAVRAISTLARTVFFEIYLIGNELQPTESSTLKPLPGEHMQRKTTAISLKCVKNCITLFIMIESFRHKGLQALFEKGTSAKVQKPLAESALRRLDAIDTAKTPDALNVPGFDFHGLRGKPKRFSVHVNGPWCITFEWQGENAIKVDLENYH